MRRGSLAIAILACLAAAAPAAAAPDPLRPQQWGMTMIGADAAQATTTGAGATVAVIDTGADFGHPDLQGRLAAGRDLVGSDDNPADGEGHGTHVAGIVAANADNGVGVIGVAPGARVLVVRVLDDEGSGSLDWVAEGIDYAVNHGADVINLSLGTDMPLLGGGAGSPFDRAIDRALDAGAVVAAAAGNDGLPACDQPSAGGRLLCVGAVDRSGGHSLYSNFGRGLGISAPGGSGVGGGADILSTYLGGTYREEAGTSQATPHVSGVAALLVSLGVRGQAAVQRILQTARDAGFAGPDSFYGAGIVDARAAVAGLARTGGGPAPRSGASGPAARISLARVLRIRDVLRRGIAVRCAAAGRGHCRVWADAGRRRIATGARAVSVGRAVTVVARLTPRGRAQLWAALRSRRPRTIRATVRIALPGVRTQLRTLLLRR
jgi:subtilisin family serine protease